MLILCGTVLLLVVREGSCFLNKTEVTLPAADSEVDLPPPTLLHSLYQTVTSVLETPWSDSEHDSRQAGTVNGGIRITLGGLLLSILATAFGVIGFGSVGLLAAKALSIGTLALFLTALSSLKKHKSDSGGQTVHYVPIHGSGGHHDYLQERSEFLPPYLDRNV